MRNEEKQERINRRFTPIHADYELFCLSGDDDKQNHSFSELGALCAFARAVFRSNGSDKLLGKAYTFTLAS